MGHFLSFILQLVGDNFYCNENRIGDFFEDPTMNLHFRGSSYIIFETGHLEWIRLLGLMVGAIDSQHWWS